MSPYRDTVEHLGDGQARHEGSSGVGPGSLRIGVVIHGEQFGGAERMALSLANGLASRGHTVSLVALSERLFQIYRHECDGISAHVLKASSFVGRCRELRAILTAGRISVLQTNGYAPLAVSVIGRQADSIPVIATQHGARERTNSVLSGWRSRLYRIIESGMYGLSNVHGVYVSRELSGRFPLRFHRCRPHVILNGLDTPQFAFRRVDPVGSGTRRDVLIAGRLVHAKGVDLAIKSLIEPAMPDDVSLRIVGDGPERASLERLSQQLGVAARVKFCGFSADMAKEYATAWAVLMPSRHEGLPYAMLEALSAGVPFVGAAVGGIQEVISDGVSGLLFPPERPSAIATCLRKLHDAPDLASRLTVAARKMVDESLSLDSMVSSYENLAHELLRGSRQEASKGIGSR